MNSLQIIIDRLKSENPKFFNIIILIGFIFYIVAQALIWANGYHNFLTAAWSSMLDDVCASSLTAMIVAQLTKKPTPTKEGEQNKPNP